MKKLLMRVFDKLRLPSVAYDVRYKVPVGAWKRVRTGWDLKYVAQHKDMHYTVTVWFYGEEKPWYTMFSYEGNSELGIPVSSHIDDGVPLI